MTKVKGTLSGFGTASVTFAKTFGKTYVEESGKYANTLFGGVATDIKVISKATTAAVKDAKSALRMVKAGQNGFVDGVSGMKLLVRDSKTWKN